MDVQMKTNSFQTRSCFYKASREAASSHNLLAHCVLHELHNTQRARKLVHGDGMTANKSMYHLFVRR